jgi:hypothetical protein
MKDEDIYFSDIPEITGWSGCGNGFFMNLPEGL